MTKAAPASTPPRAGPDRPAPAITASEPAARRRAATEASPEPAASIDAPVLKARREGALSRTILRSSSGQPRRSKADEAYHAIRAAILDGTLPPGAAIDKPAICRDLRLSRFPVTAAIARLAFERLVDVEPQRGSFVSRIAASDARELMLVRRGIEVEVAGEAALRLDEASIALLGRIMRYQKAALDAGDHQDFHRLDHAFHDQILEMLGFLRTGEILEGLRTRVDRVRRMLLPVPGRMKRTFQEHQAILQAIASHDPLAARTAMRDHLERVLEEFDVLAREKPELFAP